MIQKTIFENRNISIVIKSIYSFQGIKGVLKKGGKNIVINVLYRVEYNCLCCTEKNQFYYYIYQICGERFTSNSLLQPLF